MNIKNWEQTHEMITSSDFYIHYLYKMNPKILKMIPKYHWILNSAPQQIKNALTSGLETDHEMKHQKM